jgi:GNAT superfamily N-acetyltransferase
MIHGTRTSSTCVSDAAMAIGAHEPEGTTVALHSLCVHPGWRAKGLGTQILREYIKRMESENGVKRIALIAHDELVPFYERHGFDNSYGLIVGSVSSTRALVKVSMEV